MEKRYTYTILLEPAEEGGYTVTVPALPGVANEGDSYEQALAMAEDAVGCHLAALAKHGDPIPVEVEHPAVHLVRAPAPHYE